MRGFASILLLLLTSAMGRVEAQAKLPAEDRLRVRVSGGYERENFSWSIAGNGSGQDPNVLSELKWRSVGGVSAGIDLEARIWRRWRGWLSGGRVWTRWGRLTDTDYGLDNRNDQLYRAQLPVTDGSGGHIAVGAGYDLLRTGSLRVTPFAGYGLEEQTFLINGGGYAQLDSRYASKWMGPLVKLAAEWAPAKRWRLNAEGGYSQVVYRATADWNLIPEFSHPVSFRHHADGFGVRGALGVRYAVTRGIGVLAEGNCFDWETGTGIDALYLQTGERQQTQLNGVRRDGWGARIGVEWWF